ncbi:disrupted in schizophrenia 1 protein [Erpetoichthys calabaricus]|uniref:disrupted in schizophrenia 1 protein n=1 Tax=Erpetoichthys calabaricus TaxID=27687 RepID=UPI00223488F1|nr:disrupted in schizophrenia 1 protein [Erpetoichthys calabaricus]
MFTGMVKLDGPIISSSGSRSPQTQAGSPMLYSMGGSSRRKKLHRRPGYMRGAPKQCLEFSMEENSKRPCLGPVISRTAYSDMQNVALDDRSVRSMRQGEMESPASNVLVRPRTVNSDLITRTQAEFFNRSPESSCVQSELNNSMLETMQMASLQSRRGTVLFPKDNEAAIPTRSEDLDRSLTKRRPSDLEQENSQPSDDTFNSSFSFIQLSLASDYQEDFGGCSLQSSKSAEPVLAQDPQLLFADAGLDYTLPKDGADSLPDQDLWKDPEFWQFSQSDEVQSVVDTGLKEGLQDLDMLPFDTEVAFSFSLDLSDAASAGSSVTSGYESSTTTTESSCDVLLKQYDGILNDCLQSRRASVKIESLILKLLRLQEKAIREDDYDRADKFRQKLVELRKEKSLLKLGLPSMHPCVSRLIERLKDQLQSSLQQTPGSCGANKEEMRAKQKSEKEKVQFCLFRRDQLLQEKQHLQNEIHELRRTLAELMKKDCQLTIEIEEEDRLIQTQDSKLPSILTTSLGELSDLNKVLDEMVASAHRVQSCTDPPEHIKSLQEKEQFLSASVKEATAKVFMSQKLCSSLRKKVSDIETQLATFEEAKITAVTGNDFSTAKDLKQEMVLLGSEKDRLEELLLKAQTLSRANTEALDLVKGDYAKVRLELERNEAYFEKNLRENAAKYMDLLEDKLHSCGSPLLTRVWEADLEACRLLLRGLQLKETGFCISEGDESRTDETEHLDDLCSEMDTKKESQFHPPGSWGDIPHVIAKGNSQDQLIENLEECLFNKEAHQSEVCWTGTANIMQQCESISEKLLSLEDQLQVAILQRDKGLTHILSLFNTKPSAAFHCFIVIKPYRMSQEQPNCSRCPCHGVVSY